MVEFECTHSVMWYKCHLQVVKKDISFFVFFIFYSNFYSGVQVKQYSGMSLPVISSANIAGLYNII